tara:strand:+ start:1339 stop:2106 length:768 start_codon:yes stop_codon:yes gene_type:complete
MRSKFFDENNYSINENGKYGIYIIHGFSSTTYEAKELINFLSKKKYYIKADNLPGHGTTSEDCNLTTYQEWISHVERGVAEMVSRCNNVFVIGSSMGAVLALHLAALFPLKGIVCGSTHILFKKNFKINYLLPIFFRFISDIPKKTQFDLHTHKNNPQYYGYLEYPIVALNEMRRLINVVKKELSNVQCPTLIIHSLNDQTALIKNAEFVNYGINSKIKEIFYVNKSHHNIFDSHKNPDQKFVFNKIEQFIKQHL